jgi:hypothetical protein
MACRPLGARLVRHYGCGYTEGAAIHTTSVEKEKKWRARIRKDS